MQAASARRTTTLPGWVMPVAVAGWAFAVLALWWQHYPLVRTLDALREQVRGGAPVQVQALRVHRATGAGCGRLLDGSASRNFVVTADGQVMLEPLEMRASGQYAIASLPAWKDFWRTTRSLCPDAAP